MQDVGKMDVNVPASTSEPNTRKSAAFPFIINHGAELFQRERQWAERSLAAVTV